MVGKYLATNRFSQYLLIKQDFPVHSSPTKTIRRRKGLLLKLVLGRNLGEVTLLLEGLGLLTFCSLDIIFTLTLNAPGGRLGQVQQDRKPRLNSAFYFLVFTAVQHVKHFLACAILQLREQFRKHRRRLRFIQ